MLFGLVARQDLEFFDHMSRSSPPHCAPKPQRDFRATLRFIDERKAQQLTLSPSTPAAGAPDSKRRARRPRQPSGPPPAHLKADPALSSPTSTEAPAPSSPTEVGQCSHTLSPTVFLEDLWADDTAVDTVQADDTAVDTVQADAAVDTVQADAALPGSTGSPNAADTFARFVDRVAPTPAPVVPSAPTPERGAAPPVGNPLDILAGLAINYIHTLVEGAQSASSSSGSATATPAYQPRVYQPELTTRAKYHSNPNSDWAVRKRQRAAAHHARQLATDEPEPPPRFIPRIECVGCHIAQPAARCSNRMCGPCCLASELSCAFHK